MKHTFLSVLVCGLLFAGFFASIAPVAHAVTPSLTLSKTSATTGQITVYGDFSSSVRLNYGPSASQVAQIGTTDQAGNLSLPISLSGYAVACGNRAYVTINGQESASIAWAIDPALCSSNTNSTAAISFSQDDAIVNVGQSQSIVIYGSGSSFYSVSSNSNSSAISTSINGNILTVSALTFGGATIKVCSNDNQCGTINVVAVNNGPQQTPTYTQPFGLASFMVASNNATGKFVNPGNKLTITFSGNRPLSNVTARINGSPVNVSGGGTGPYTASYTVTGNEAPLFPVALTFSDLSGTAGQATFALGSLSSSVSTPSIPVAPSTPTPTPTPSAPAPAPSPAPISGAAYTFTKFLSVDDTGPEVTALQKRLTALGFYSGPITGTFGPLTAAAVKKLQKTHNIKQAGYVGPGTRAVLNK